MAAYLPTQQLTPISKGPAGIASHSKRRENLFCHTNEDAAFFERTPENWVASQAGDKYMDFAKNMIQNPAWADRESEPFFFAMQTIGLDGFECGVNLDGCKQRPTCDDVLTFLGNKDDARWVWFVLEAMHRLTLVGAVIDQQTVPSQVDLSTIAEDAVHTFLRKIKQDDAKDRQCHLLVGLVKAAISTTFSILGSAMTAAAPAAGAAAPVVASSAAASSAYLGRGLGTLASYANMFAGNVATNVGGQAIEDKMCPVKIDNKGLEQDTRIRIKKDMDAFYRTYRTFIQTTNSDIIKGVTHDDDPSVSESTLLANVIRSGEYLRFSPEQEKRFEKEGHLIEADMNQYYKNALVATLLKDQMCYIHCSPQKPETSDITNFEPESGKFCNARCFQDWGSGEGDLEVYGIDAISYDANPWGIEIQGLLKDSYDNYKKNGFRTDPTIPSADQLFHDSLTPAAGSFLPVCDSYLGPPKNDGGFSGIPCMCGDEYGGETTQFWTAAGFDKWAATKVEDVREVHKGPPYLCKNDMAIAQTLPVPYFINMCNLDWRWPQVTDYNQFVLMKGRDSRCEAFIEEAQNVKYNLVLDVNCNLCFDSPVAKKVYHGPKKQKDAIKNLFLHFTSSAKARGDQSYNFHRACEIMEENNGKCPR
ncbi:MAG: hypothetical protein Q9169_006926 [Polycauliona sp. 2 TL-2023]